MLRGCCIPVSFSVTVRASSLPVSSLQEEVLYILWPVCRIRVRRSTLHEGKAETELTATFGAVVAQPRRIQVSPIRVCGELKAFSHPHE